MVEFNINFTFNFYCSVWLELFPVFPLIQKRFYLVKDKTGVLAFSAFNVAVLSAALATMQCFFSISLLYSPCPAVAIHCLCSEPVKVFTTCVGPA